MLPPPPPLPLPSQYLGLAYTASTAPLPFRSPAFAGVNVGHNWDPSWVTYIKRMGVNAARIFGLAGPIPTLQKFVAGGGGTWGNDLNNNAVTTQLTFTAAIAQLRSATGRNPASASTFANPPLWAAFSALMTTADNTTATGNSMQAQVTALQAVGIEPLLVFWLTCPVFSFSTLNMQNATYWAEHWEVRAEPPPLAACPREACA